MFIGKVFIALPVLASTNLYASELLRQEPAPMHGTVVFSSGQYEGRGQRGNSWSSENGKNVALSIILYPRQLSIGQQFYLSMAIALGVCRFLQNELNDLDVTIKWPNDLFVGDKKIGGILIENTLSGNSLLASVVGIGLNINQTHFPDLPFATSYKLLTGKELDLMDTVQKLCCYVEAAYFLLKPDKLADLKRQYLHSLYHYGEFRRFKRVADDSYFDARITDVLENGRLLLTLIDATTLSFDIKELVWV
jgi:BirA family biotin operon repressor/biotin-[acetyl-CoA-carboxylase] ligase